MNTKVKVTVRTKPHNIKIKIVNPKIKIKNVGYKVYEIIEVGTIELGLTDW